MNLVRSRGWGQVKPPAGAQINWAHPLAQGLRFAALPNTPGSGIDLVRQVKPTAGWKTSRQGLQGGNVLAEVWTAPYGAAAVRSFLVGAQILGAIGSDVRFMQSTNSILRVSDASTLNVLSEPGSFSGFQSQVTTITAMQIGDVVPLGFSHNPSLLQLYARGRQVASVASTGTPSVANTAIQFGSTDTNSSNGAVVYAYEWDRKLTPDEFLWLAAEPYAFVAPPGPKVLYLDLGTSAVIAKFGTAYASAGAVMLDSSTKAALGQATAEAGATARDAATKATTGATLAPTAAAARTTAKKGGVGATIASAGAAATTTAKKAIVGAVRWALGLVGYAHPAVIRRDIDYRVADAPIAWRAGDVDTAWEAADAPTAWKAGDA